MTMQEEVMRSASKEPICLERVDAAIAFTGLLVRVLAYGACAAVLPNYPCGPAILSGLFFGDVAATVALGLVHLRSHGLQMVCELMLLGLIYLWAQGSLTWPADPAERAIVILVAFGVLTARGGKGLMTNLVADDPFA
ncbi:MAG: hypothetical protein AB8H80_10370 [Planctomycetota bacterium]